MIGACLLSGDARDVLLRELAPGDFYQPAHQRYAEGIIELSKIGQQVDAVTVAGWVTDRYGPDDKALAELTQMQADVASTRSAPTYAARIRDRAARRQLWAGLREGTDEVMNLGVDVEEAIDHIEARLRSVDVGTGAEPPPLTMEEFLALDLPYRWLAPNLLERSDRVILTSAEGGGKALDVDTPILTGRGWATMGTVEPGDEVYGPDGQPTKIIAASEVMSGRPCHRVTFSGGASVVADEEHLWETHTLGYREKQAYLLRRPPTRPRGSDKRHLMAETPTVLTTGEMSKTLRARDGHCLQHAIPLAEPFDAPRAELPIDPYALGAWLGDGHTAGARLTCADQGIIDALAECGEPVRHMGGYLYTWAEPTKAGPRAGRFETRLRSLGLLGRKHIPEQYEQASRDQRLALLQGLMDTDGTVSPDGKCEFSVTDETLARDTYRLISGLGIKTTLRSGPAKLEGRTVGTRWRMQFRTPTRVFRLGRKADRQTPPPTGRNDYRYVKSVEPTASVPVRCIQVDRADGMFLVGHEMIATHNSTLLRQLAVQLAMGLHPFARQTFDPVKTLVVDVENSRQQVQRGFWPLFQAALSPDYQTTFGQDPPPAFDANRVHIEVRQQGIDLLSRRDRQWFTSRVDMVKPDVILTGPLYKLHRGDPIDERPAADLAAYFDELRTRFDCALLIEAHAPYGTDGGKQRTLRPYGASLWSRWPEFGFGIRPAQNVAETGDYDMIPWRGARDASRVWPRKLRQGKVWPWINALMADYDQEEAF